MSDLPPIVEAPPIEPSSTGSSPPVAPKRSQLAAKAEAQQVTAPAVSSIGILLINLGTPDAAEPKAVRRYLKEFLTDPRAIENNSVLWKFVLNGIILPLRSRRKAHDYKRIGTTRKMNLR